MPFDGTNLNKLAAHLLLAKRAIEEFGWCQAGRDATGARCVLAAIWASDPGWPMGPAEVYARAVGLEFGVDVGSWNDAPDRTLADVLAGFDAAIALAMAEETTNAND